MRAIPTAPGSRRRSRTRKSVTPPSRTTESGRNNRRRITGVAASADPTVSSSPVSGQNLCLQRSAGARLLNDGAVVFVCSSVMLEMPEWD